MFLLFSCPIFLGHPRARGRCSQGERVLYGRDLCRSGGTGKAEAAKMPGAGIWPQAVPRKMRGRKRHLSKSVSIGEERSGLESVERCKLLVTQRDHRIDAHRTPRGNIAGEQRHRSEQARCANIRQRVHGRNTRQQISRKVPNRAGQQSAHQDACRRHYQALPKNHLQDARPGRAESHSDADLVRALGRSVRNDSVDSDQAEQKAQSAQRCGQCGADLVEQQPSMRSSP
jgi:hypothetical protein